MVNTFRLSTRTPAADLLFFYDTDHLLSVIGNDSATRILRGVDVLLAETGHTAKMLAVDKHNAVLCVINEMHTDARTYAPYGYSQDRQAITVVSGFNGERRLKELNRYVTGQGYRLLSTPLRRFDSPDDLSPFGKGGINSYMYCSGDPVNAVDPSGHSGIFIETFKQTRLSTVKTVTKRTAGTQISADTKVVRSGKNQFYVREWQREPQYRYSVTELNEVKINPFLGGGVGVVHAESYATYRVNNSELGKLLGPSNMPQTKMAAERTSQLFIQQLSFLNEAGGLLGQALDPADLSTAIRGRPRVTPGSSISAQGVRY